MMKRIALAERPKGVPTDKNFRLEEIAMPDPQDAEVLVEINYMSLDPYMRGRMDDVKSYAKPVNVGDTMEGGAVGQVIASKSDKFAVGDLFLVNSVGRAMAVPTKQCCANLIQQWPRSQQRLVCSGCRALRVGTG